MIDKGQIDAFLTEQSIVQMDRKMFSYKREMKQLFANSANQFGAGGGRDTEDREERKRGGLTAQIEAQMEGASRKQKKYLK